MSQLFPKLCPVSHPTLLPLRLWEVAGGRGGPNTESLRRAPSPNPIPQAEGALRLCPVPFPQWQV
jgi:hypothetical protein